MDTQFDHSLLDDKKSEAGIAAPPPLEVDVRTMESDLKAFKETGGEVPTTGMSQTLNSQVQDQTEQAQSQQQPQQIPSLEVPKQSSGMLKNIITTIVVVVAIVGMGLLGYFVIFPKFFAK